MNPANRRDCSFSADFMFACDPHRPVRVWIREFVDNAGILGISIVSFRANRQRLQRLISGLVAGCILMLAVGCGSPDTAVSTLAAPALDSTQATPTVMVTVQASITPVSPVSTIGVVVHTPTIAPSPTVTPNPPSTIPSPPLQPPESRCCQLRRQ